MWLAFGAPEAHLSQAARIPTFEKIVVGARTSPLYSSFDELTSVRRLIGLMAPEMRLISKRLMNWLTPCGEVRDENTGAQDRLRLTGRADSAGVAQPETTVATGER